MMHLLLIVAAYLIGAFPTSYLAGRVARGVDLRTLGSGNLGATNTFRVLGARVAAPVMVIDMAKGFIPAWFFPLWDGSAAGGWALAYGAAAIVGHVFPVYLRFRGGKGVATAGGVFLALSPGAVGIALIVWLVVLAMARMVALASISAAFALVVALFALDGRPLVIGVGALVGAFVIVAHRANIRRILRGEEHRFGRPRAGAAGTAPGQPGATGQMGATHGEVDAEAPIPTEESIR
jgi:acyl phosphate:glycerol-3-phosphate acyltransferase